MIVGAPQEKMNTYVSLCISPIVSNEESFKENPGVQSYCSSHYSKVAVATLVTLAHETEHKKFDLTSKQRHSCNEPSRVN